MHHLNIFDSFTFCMFLADPKLTTPNVSALIVDLEYCTKYNFAVTVLDEGATSDTVKINTNTVRTVITGAAQLTPPLNLTVSF